MVMAMTVVNVSADTTSNKITITSKTDGHTYSAYQIFDGDLTDKGVLSNIVWGSGVDKDKEKELLQALIDLKSIYTTDNCKSARDVAQLLSDNNKANIASEFADVVASYLASPATKSVNTGTKVSDQEYTYVLDGLDPGYYFVKDEINSGSEKGNAVSKYILKVVKDVEVTAKTDVPSVTKKVKEDNDTTPGRKDNWNDAADYDIGDDVPFRLVGYVPDMQYYDEYFYQFNDVLSSALDFNADSVHVYLASGDSMDAVNRNQKIGAGGTEIVNPSDGKVIYSVSTETNGFKVTFADLKKVTGITAGQYIVVEYTAKLNSSAVIGNPGNPNKVTLEYSNNPNDTGHGTTKEDEVVVFTFGIPVNKVIAGTETSLAGAKFALFANEDDANAAAANPSDLSKALSFTKVTKEDGSEEAGSYKLAVTSTTEGVVQELVTDTSAQYKIQGLDQGTYYLVETVAPDGYNRLLTAQKVEIKPTYVESTYDAHTPGSTGDQLSSVGVSLNAGVPATEVKIENNEGATLPETGGIGTTIFYVLGAILVIGAGLVLVTKKRMGAEK